MKGRGSRSRKNQDLPPEIRISLLGEKERQFTAVCWLRNFLTSVRVGEACFGILCSQQVEFEKRIIDWWCNEST
jgi:hypothetical protein